MLKRLLFLTFVTAAFFMGASQLHAKADLATLIQDTKDFSGRVRAAAIAEIGESVDASMIKRNKILELLMDILREDPNLRVRREAVAALSAVATKGVAVKEMAKLADPIMAIAADKAMAPLIRRDAVKLTPQLLDSKSLGYDSIRQGMLKILNNKKEAIGLRAEALKSLAQFGGEQNLEVIMGYLKNRDEEIAAAAVLALANAADQITLDKCNLTRILSIIKEIKDEEVLVVVLRAVSRIQLDEYGERDAKGLIKSYIEHENDEVMIYTAVIAQGIDYVEVIPTLGKRLAKPFEDPENAVRLVDVLAGFSDRLASAPDARTLRGNLNHLKAIYAIYANLLQKTEDPKLGAALAWVYGDIPEIMDRNKAFEDLVALLSVEGPIGAAALNSLKMITGELYGPNLKKWQQWQEKNRKALKAKKIR